MAISGYLCIPFIFLFIEKPPILSHLLLDYSFATQTHFHFLFLILCWQLATMRKINARIMCCTFPFLKVFFWFFFSWFQVWFYLSHFFPLFACAILFGWLFIFHFLSNYVTWYYGIFVFAAATNVSWSKFNKNNIAYTNIKCKHICHKLWFITQCNIFGAEIGPTWKLSELQTNLYSGLIFWLILWK